MDINKMTEFLKKTLDGCYILQEVHGAPYNYMLKPDQHKALQDFIDGRAKIDNKIFELEQKQKAEQDAKEEAKELDRQFEKSELAELIT
jgi:hypothetical protein